MPARFRSTSEKPAGAVRQLAGVFLEVDARQPAPAAPAAVLPDGDLEPARRGENGRSYWLI